MGSRSSRSGREAAGSKGKRRSNNGSNSRISNSTSSTARSRSKQSTGESMQGGRSTKPAKHNDQHSGGRSGNGQEQRHSRSKTRKGNQPAARSTDSNAIAARTRSGRQQMTQRAAADKKRGASTAATQPLHKTEPTDMDIMGSDSSSTHALANVIVPVLYEDNHVIGVVKPVNIPSQADDTGDADMLTLIKQDLKQRHQKEGNVFLGLVHRLDRPVGGAMLFAKTSKGASRLSDSVRSGKLGKRYIAVLRGIPSRSHATLKNTLLKNLRTNTSAVVAPGTAGGKDAVLDYEVLATDQQANLSLVLIKLHTGRSHQIRVQMAHAGHPLFGDQRYGSGLNRPGEQLALWSVLASAPHPVKDELVSIISLPPRTKPWTQWSEALYDQLAKRLEYELD